MNRADRRATLRAAAARSRARRETAARLPGAAAPGAPHQPDTWSGRVAIRVITHPDDVNTGPLVSAYDPDGNAGRGSITVTHDPTRALTFPTMAEAVACYRQTSTTHPTRPDGQPNRPLTAYTVAFDVLED